MGFLWDLLQQSQIGRQRRSTDNLESRVRNLERELDETRATLAELISRLERRLGEDLDRDGQIG